MTENQLVRESFKIACLDGQTLDELLLSLSSQALKLWLEKLVPSNICHDCKQPLDSKSFHIKIGYWYPYWYPVHKQCYDKNYTNDVIECQTIDADCNDCKYFKRGPLVKQGSFSGLCQLYNKLTFGHPNFSTGHKCFEHRKKAI